MMSVNKRQVNFFFERLILNMFLYRVLVYSKGLQDFGISYENLK